ncbi:MAG: flagellar basal body-associated FliL family protein [Burkholderiaceae bacterium]
MSATTAPAAKLVEPVEPVAPKSGKKKLVIIAVVLAIVLAVGGGGAAVYLKKKHAAAEQAAEAAGEGGAESEAGAQPKLAKASLKNAPTFVPLEPFTVNLADREVERFAQVGMTLELTDPKAGDLLKAYMPAIRNNVLLVLASKTAAQLIEHSGKVQLAAEVRAAALKPLGYAAEPGPAATTDAAAKAHPSDEEDAPPIRAVHFSNFIIQ